MALQRACFAAALIALAIFAACANAQLTPAATYTPTRCFFTNTVQSSKFSYTFDAAAAAAGSGAVGVLRALNTTYSVPYDQIQLTLIAVRDTSVYQGGYCSLFGKLSESNVLDREACWVPPSPNQSSYYMATELTKGTAGLSVSDPTISAKLCPGDGEPGNFTALMQMTWATPETENGHETYTTLYPIGRTTTQTSKLQTTKLVFSPQMATSGSKFVFSNVSNALPGDSIAVTTTTTCPTSSAQTSVIAVTGTTGTSTVPSNFGAAGSWKLCAYGVASATDSTLLVNSGQLLPDTAASSSTLIPALLGAVAPQRDLPPLTYTLSLTQAGSTTTGSDRFTVLPSNGDCSAASTLSPVATNSGASVTVTVTSAHVPTQGAAYTLCYALPATVGGVAVGGIRSGGAPAYATSPIASDMVFVPGITGITPTRVGPNTVVTLNGRYMASPDQVVLGSTAAKTLTIVSNTQATWTLDTALPTTSPVDVTLMVGSKTSTPLSGAATVVSFGAISPSRIAFGQTVTISAGTTGQLGQGATAAGDAVTWVLSSASTCPGAGSDTLLVQQVDGSASAVKVQVTSQNAAVNGTSATQLGACYSVGSAAASKIAASVLIAKPGSLTTKFIRRAPKSPLLISSGANLLGGTDELLLDVDAGCPTPDVPATVTEAQPSPGTTGLFALLDTSALTTNATLQTCVRVNGQGPTPTAGGGPVTVMPVTGVLQPRVPATLSPIPLTVLGAGLQSTDSWTVRVNTTFMTCDGATVATVTNPTISGGGAQAAKDILQQTAGRYEVCYQATGLAGVGLADSLFVVSATGFSPSRIIASAPLSLTVTGTQVSSAGDRVGIVAAASCGGAATPYGGDDEASGATTVFLPTAPADPAEDYSLCYSVGGSFAPQLVGTAESIEVVRLDNFTPSKFVAEVSVTLTITGVNLDGSADVLALHSQVAGAPDCSAATRVYPAADALPLAATGINSGEVTFTFAVPLSANYSICYGVDNGTVWAPVAGGRLVVSCAADNQCDDSVYCNGAETCNTALGECQAGTAVNCEPAELEPCIAYLCNETSEACYEEYACNCGDGIVQRGEGCDTGGTFSEGCLNCTVTSGWRCAGEPSLCRLRSSATALVLSLPVAIILLLAALLL